MIVRSEIRKDTICIQALSNEELVPVDNWSNKDTTLDFCTSLIAEDKATVEDGTKLILPYDTVAEMTPFQIKCINLPKANPYIFTCSSTGTELRQDYQINYSFKDGRRTVNVDNIKIPFMEINGKKYTVLNPIYRSIQLIDQINECSRTTNEQSTKLKLFQELKKNIPFESLQNDSQLKEMNIVVSDQFSLEMVDRNECKFVPKFVNSVYSNDNNGEDYRDQSTEGEFNDANEEILDSLHKHKQEQFENHFLKRDTVQDTYALDGTFLVIPEKTKTLIKVIKKTLSEGNIAKKRSLFYSPNKFFKDVLGDGFTEEHDHIFVSSEKYQSDRISHIGIWQPKLQGFLPPPQKNEWFPEYCMGIRLAEGDIIQVKPTEINPLIDDIDNAIKEGEETVELHHQEINATTENLKICKEFRDKIEEILGDGKKKESPAKIVAIIKDNLEKDLYEDKESRRKVQQKFIPKMLDTSKLKEGKLFDHQEEGIAWLQESWNQSKRGVLLADDMGLGKTLQVLVFLAWLRELELSFKLKDKKPYLLVAPRSLLNNWKIEHNKFLKGEGLGCIKDGLSNNEKKDEREAIDKLKRSNFVLITYDSLAKFEHIFRKISWKVIVFDECQAIKNPSSFRTDMAKAMAADFSIGMTGTPVENRLGDLWCISDAVYPGFLKTYKEFKKEYESTNNTDKLSKKMKGEQPTFMLRRMKVDHIEGLPEKTEHVERQSMTPEQQSEYDKVIQNVSDRNYFRKHMVAIQHLKSVSLAPEFSEDIEDEVFINSSARLVACFKILDEIKARDEKALLFLESRRLQPKIAGIIQRKYQINKPYLINGLTNKNQIKQMIDTFQNSPSGFDVMLLSPKVGGVGLTLTRANNVIHLERWWNPAVEDQCSDRVYRIGQNKNVNVYIPMAIHPKQGKKSFDEILHGILSKKRELSREVITVTSFSSDDYKTMYEQTTGSEYVGNRDKDFYKSNEWRTLRYQIIKRDGERCKLCGKGVKDGAGLHVDHIKPRSKYPELELDPDNLQVLCDDCNIGKSNK